MENKNKLSDRLAGSKKAALAAVILPVLYSAALFFDDSFASVLLLIINAVFFCIALINYLDMRSEKKSINSPVVVTILILSLLFAILVVLFLAVAALNGGLIISPQR